MGKMKIVRTLLYLLLLAGEYQPQSASVEAHYMPLLAANKQNLLCATNTVLLEKRVMIIGIVFATVVIICLPSVRCLCNIGKSTVQALWRIVRKCQILGRM